MFSYTHYTDTTSFFNVYLHKGSLTLICRRDFITKLRLQLSKKYTIIVDISIFNVYKKQCLIHKTYGHPHNKMLKESWKKKKFILNCTLSVLFGRRRCMTTGHEVAVQVRKTRRRVGLQIFIT